MWLWRRFSSNADNPIQWSVNGSVPDSNAVSKPSYPQTVAAGFSSQDADLGIQQIIYCSSCRGWQWLLVLRAIKEKKKTCKQVLQQYKPADKKALEQSLTAEQHSLIKARYNKTEE